MKIRHLWLTLTLTVALLGLTACQNHPAKTTTPQHSSQKKTVRPQNQQTYDKKDVQAYWLSYRHKTGSYDGITDKLFDIIHHKGAFYYGN